MKFFCKILNKHFDSQKEMFKSLKDNQEQVMQIKKAAIKLSDPISLSIQSKTEATKGLRPVEKVGAGDYVFPVINTTKFLDSHDDVHLDGLWEKSVKEQQGKTFLIINHDMAIGKVIAWPKDVEIMVKELPWSELGADYSGNTQALIFKSKLSEKSNKDAFQSYVDGDPVQHSIRMQYVKLRMAINSKDYKEEYEAWKTYYDQIVNKDRADEQGYFFAILEAKIYKEGSMVLEGSNSMTPTLYDIEPQDKHSKKEPSIDTLSYLTENFKL